MIFISYIIGSIADRARAESFLSFAIHPPRPRLGPIPHTFKLFPQFFSSDKYLLHIFSFSSFSSLSLSLSRVMGQRFIVTLFDGEGVLPPPPPPVPCDP